MSDVKLIIDGARMAELLRSPTGPVGRHLIERGEIVKQAAKTKAPRRTGCLADSIVKRFEARAEGLAIIIQCDTTPCSPERKSYALYVHEPTEPHQIVAKNGGVLSFIWHGERVFFTSVSHPGWRGNPFLRDALPLAVV
jgi:hypothetical protein